MTDLDATLTPAQWEHWDRHGWTLTVAPTEPSTDPTSAMLRAEHAHGRSLSSIARACGITRERVRQLVTATAPVPATVPCPERDCRGGQVSYPEWEGRVEDCPTCHGSGVVPRTVGIIRPERQLVGWSDYYGRHSDGASDPCPTGRAASCPVCVVIPAERVGTATVTPVPVVDERGWLHDEDTPAEALVVELDDSLVLVSHHEQFDASALFATPPAPGTTVWRLDRNEER